MIYKGIIQSRSLYRRVLVLIACAILLYLEFMRGQYLYIVLTLFLVLAVFHHKEHIVSEEGVDIKYSLFGMTTTNRWTWDQITAVQPDYIKERPNARVLFQKDAVLRSFLFSPEDCRGVLKLAAEMNPTTFVDDYTAEEQEQMAEEKRKKQEQLRAQRVKNKKAKKERK